jgi:hypothetical protein
MLKRNKNINYLSIATLLFYFYFLVIASFHIHQVNLEYFPGNGYSEADTFHDFYETDNFCKLHSSSSSLYMSSGDAAWDFYVSADNSSQNYVLNTSLIRTISGNHLRAPPSLF